MRLWWRKSSSKEPKKKVTKESRSGGPRRHNSDTVSEKGSRSRAESRSPSPSSRASRCQSFAERPRDQPLPLPVLHPAGIGRTDSEISISTKRRLEKGSKFSLFPPLPRLACIRRRPDPTDLDRNLASPVSIESSIDSDDPTDSCHLSPQAIDFENGTKTAASSPSSVLIKEQNSDVAQTSSRDSDKSANLLLTSHVSSSSPKQRPLSSHVPNLQVPYQGVVYIAPDSSMSSPSRSPIRTFGPEQVINSGLCAGKPFSDVNFLGSGQCSSTGSGQNSGHNSMGGDMSGQLFWHSRSSPEYSPIPSPRMTSPGPSSRIQSGAVTPLHPSGAVTPRHASGAVTPLHARAGGGISESQTSWPDDGKQQRSHRLPLPPLKISNTSPFSHSNSAATSPSLPRSPGRAENLPSPSPRWKKGRLLGRGTFGHVYVGFNSESGEMCAMKEVILFSDDAKSKESAKQLGQFLSEVLTFIALQEIALLSRLHHPNIVQYYGSETVGDRLYIYLEYVSGGSIHKLLQEYGQLGEYAIRSYTHQILSGLAYLHAKKTVHRDIKGANILVDPNGRIKLADFGMAKHITGQSCPLSFKGSPYWMAPEVIKNSNGCNPAVDIWSLGCTVLEMATTKPPWSQYKGVAAMFKIGNSKELPAIPDNLSDDGKDFVRQCLQRNPLHRPTATQLLEHPFMRNAAPLERPIPDPEPSDPPPGITCGMKSMGTGLSNNLSSLDSERPAVDSSRGFRTGLHPSESLITKNISCPLSPIGSPLLHSSSPQLLSGRMSPSPIWSPPTTSGSSTPLTGGSDSTPFHHHWKQSAYSQILVSMPKSLNNLYMNGLSQHDPNLEALGGMQPGSHIFRDRMSCENDIIGNLGRAHHEVYDGQSVLVARVSQQLEGSY
ncbi:Protein kinase domain [Dillenia turbinata]|uniref:mitogen-activated protein kinase kinase kinase n=1 Tax=Dillenia turbinata TaxID=194707 RepID=A0AAN8VW09_9MAGN